MCIFYIFELLLKTYEKPFIELSRFSENCFIDNNFKKLRKVIKI